jgi:hypothetical protein
MRSCLTVTSVTGIGEAVVEETGRRKEDTDKKTVR